MTQIIGKRTVPKMSALERNLGFEAIRLGNSMVEAALPVVTRTRMLADAIVFLQARLEQVSGEADAPEPAVLAQSEAPERTEGDRIIASTQPRKAGVAEKPDAPEEDLSFLD